MSNNLNLPQMSANQAQKEVTHNDGIGALDAAITENFEADVTAGNVSLTNAQFREAVHFLVSGATVAGRELTVPAIKHAFFVTADPGNSDPISVVRGTTSFSIEPNTTSLFYTDSTANGLVQVAGGGGSTSTKIGSFFVGVPGAGDAFLKYVFTEAISIPAGMTGSQGAAAVAATAQSDFDVLKNGVSVGTIRFAASATTSTFIMGSPTSFVAGDVLDITAPNPQDATLSDIALTIVGSI